MPLARSPTHLARSAPDANPRGRSQEANEFFADFLVHAAGLAGAVAGALTLVLVAASRGWDRIAPIGVYAAALVAMFAASAAYNLGYNTRFRPLLRRLDHSAIFLMIAGTYTPFTTCLLNGSAALWSTVWVWSMALGGILLKLRTPRLFERVGVPIYLMLGWSIIAVYEPIAAALTAWPLALLFAGGALYTLGVGVHFRERWRFHNAIWHIFVLAAAACHFTSILTGVAMR